MSKKKTAQTTEECDSLEIQRLVPTQKRSRERYELILTTATEIIVEKGSESLKMSDIVEKAGVPHGSLYQYFADKNAIIGTLAERCNLEGRACVETHLSDVSTQKELHAALMTMTDEYYEVFINEPLMRDIWHATQSNRLLQKLDAEDMEILSAMLAKVIQKLKPESDPHKVSIASLLIMNLISATVRHAMTLEPKEGELMIAAFKRIFPKNLSALLGPVNTHSKSALEPQNRPG